MDQPLQTDTQRPEHHMRYAVLQWSYNLGEFIRTDYTFPSEEGAKAWADSQERFFSWMTPAPRYIVRPIP